MTGKEAFRRALQLLNYTDADGEPDSAAAGELYKRGLAIVDQLCTELSEAETGRAAPPLYSLGQALPLTDRTARQILPYGIAMLLAAGRGDGDNQRLFAALYTEKRTTVRAAGERLTDVLPRGCDQ